MSIDFKDNEAENGGGEATLNHETQRDVGGSYSASGPWHIEEVEPWTEPVDGNALLSEVEGVIKRYVVLPRWAAETIALWVVHAYAFQLREVSTYLGIESPEKRCGKTTLLSVLSELSNRAVALANISSPAVFRAIEEKQPTLLIDEQTHFCRGTMNCEGF